MQKHGVLRRVLFCRTERARNALLAPKQLAGPAVDGKREMRVGGIARGETVDGDREEQDQRGGDGLVVVDPREEAREEGVFCGRHG